ncbi:MAG: hypothetical protein JWM51_562 [Microbacteriaceae bacterium]|nr:hypothetical protein [Microbacteriaceae bacterium]
MSNTYPSTPPVQSPTTDTSGTAGVAKEQASNVAGGVKDASGKVVGSAKEQVTQVASEAKTQAKDLFTQTKAELVDQAGTQQQRVATGLHSISGELDDMASNAPDGVASDLVQQVASRASSVASWLEQRDPGSLVDEVRIYARRHPGTFIAVAAAAGVLAGRLTRSVTSAASSDSSSSNGTPATGASTYVAPVAPSGDVFPTATDYSTSTYPEGQYPVADGGVEGTRL